jgi:hypothetical protein
LTGAGLLSRVYQRNHPREEQTGQLRSSAWRSLRCCHAGI